MITSVGHAPTRCRIECVKTHRCLSSDVCYIRVAPTRSHRLTRIEQLRYLRAEHSRLTEQFRTLRSEFETLRGADIAEWAAFQLKLQEYLGLLANHHIALEWTLYPPCGRTSPPRSSRTTLFFTPAPPPRARAAAPQNEATDLTAA